MHFSSIYLMMGEKCNFNCRYCMQHEVFTTPCPVQVNPKLVAYLNTLDAIPHHTIKGNQLKTKTLIQFYGGEPLLYFATIKYFVERLDKNKFELSIISNGELLNQEMVDYFNTYNISFTLSNDGVRTCELRNKNMLEDNHFMMLFNQLYCKSISTVVTAINYKIHEIWDYYRGIFKNNPIVVNHDYVMDMGLLEPDLCNFNFEEFDGYMKELFTYLTEKSITNTLDFYEGQYISSIAKRLLFTTSSKYVLGTTKCGVVKKALNIDMEGNIYLCHNSSIKLGDIFTCDYNEIIKNFDTKHNKYTKSEKCVNCSANVFCMGGCILVGEDARTNYYCKLHEIICNHFINFLKGFSKDIKN